ncbi:MAG: DUF6788 family protein [Dehalococcoidia bacterium]
MRKRILTVSGKIRKLERRRARILEELLVPEPLLKGGLSLVMRTCGKPNCHCAKKPGHPVWVFTGRRGAARRSQVVRQADVERVQERVATYRQFRAAIRELEAIGKEEKQLLKGLIDNRNEPYE